MSDKILELKYTLDSNDKLLKETIKQNFKRGILTTVRRNGARLKKIDDKLYYIGVKLEIVDKVEPEEAIQKVNILKQLESETLDRLKLLEMKTQDRLSKMEDDMTVRLKQMELKQLNKHRKIELDFIKKINTLNNKIKEIEKSTNSEIIYHDSETDTDSDSCCEADENIENVLKKHKSDYIETLIEFKKIDVYQTQEGDNFVLSRHIHSKFLKASHDSFVFCKDTDIKKLVKSNVLFRRVKQYEMMQKNYIDFCTEEVIELSKCKQLFKSFYDLLNI